MTTSPDVVYNRLLATASPDVAAWIRTRDTQIGATIDTVLTAVRAFARWADKQERYTLTHEGVTGALAGAIRQSDPKSANALRNLREPLRGRIVSDGLILRGVVPVWSMSFEDFVSRPEGVMVPGFPALPVVLSPDAERVKEITEQFHHDAERERSNARDMLTKLGIRGWADFPNDYRSQIEAAKGQKKAAWSAYQEADRRYTFDTDALRPIRQRVLWLESVRQAQAEDRKVPPHVARTADDMERNIDIFRFNLRPSTYIDAIEAGKRLEGRSWGDPEYHAGKERLYTALKAVIEAHPNLDDVQNDATLLRKVVDAGSYPVYEDLHGGRVNAYGKLEKEAKQRAASREKRTARKVYEERSPEYAALISERAQLKRDIAEATRTARASPAFRMIGGIATLSATAGFKVRLRDVEKKIAAIERGP